MVNVGMPPAVFFRKEKLAGQYWFASREGYRPQ